MFLSTPDRVTDKLPTNITVCFLPLIESLINYLQMFAIYPLHGDKLPTNITVCYLPLIADKLPMNMFTIYPDRVTDKLPTNMYAIYPW